jgi:hypothetical protein
MIVAFAEDLAAKSFLGRSWKAEALRIWGVEILVIELHGDVRTGIRDAQSASSDSAHTWLHAPGRALSGHDSCDRLTDRA